jgi:pimeloyl-ACP methyl ester carboxylesterase
MFILVHGAYHGGWCWDAIADLLSKDGNQVATPDLPGHGRDPGWLADQTMPNYVDSIVALLDATPSKATLVGHSMGGAIATAAATARPDKVQQIIYLAAYIPIDGESVGDVVKTDPASFVQVSRVDVEGLGAVSLKTGTLADAFYNDADARMLAFAEDRVQLQSPVPFRHKFKLNDTLAIPKSAIICSRDRAISPDHQRLMAMRAGCHQIVEIDAGHSPFVTQPQKLETLIKDLSL